MEPSANDNITNQVPIRQMSLHNPAKNKLAKDLQEELKKHFEIVEVQWVECPDLTQKPFNLAAPGLCGEPALIDLGDMSYHTIKKEYNIMKILKLLSCYHRNSFIFGVSCFKNSIGELNEQITNVFLSITNQEIKDIRNKSRITYMNTQRCIVEELWIEEHEHICNTLGIFYLCLGLMKSVLQVCVKRHRSNSQYCHDPSGFINSMQDVLQNRYGVENKLVALGGVYSVTNANWSHQLRLYDSADIQQMYHGSYCNVSMPETIISTFIGSTTDILSFPSEAPIKLNACQSIHPLNHHTAAQQFPLYVPQSDTEYLGYFCPANTLYRIDEPSSTNP